MHPARLGARVGDAVVADHRRREADDLLREARIGDGLLVAAHPGGEDGLAGGEALRADRLTAEDGPVLECEEARHASNATAPPAIVIATDSCEPLAEQPAVARPRLEGLRVDVPLALEIEEHEVGRGADGDTRPVEVEGACRSCRHSLDERSQGQEPGLHESRVQNGERRLEAGDAERRRLERNVLLVQRVWRVVGGDRLDRPVAERVEQRCAIELCAQRRVHLHVRVERAHDVVREHEMVRRHFCSRRDAGGAGAAKRGHGFRRRKMEQMDGLSFVGGEREVAFDHHRLRDRRVAGEAELGGDRAFVHMPVVRQRPLLAVQCELASGDGRVLERAAHHSGRRDGNAVVGEGDRAGVSELRHLGQLVAALAARDGGEEADGDLGLAARRLHECAECCGGVDDRIGVRHREDGAESAGRRGLRAACDRLLVFAAGRAQVHVRVDERGRQYKACTVDDPMLVRVQLLADRGDDAVVDAHVDDCVDSFHRVEDACAAHNDVRSRAILEVQHHATSAAASARTPTGPPVSTS